MNQDLLNQLKDIRVVRDDLSISSRYKAILNNHPNVVSRIEDHSVAQTQPTLLQQLYIIANSVVECPVCPACGSFLPIRTSGTNRGTFQQFCSWECTTALSHITQKKRQTTNLLKYGVDNPRKNPAVKAQIKQTKTEKYGDLSSIHEKASHTKHIKYGNPQYNNRDQAARTSLQRHGVRNFSLLSIPESLRDPQTQVDELQKMFDEGFTQDEIAAELGVCQATVSTWNIEHIKRANLVGSSAERRVKEYLLSNDISFNSNVRNILPGKMELDIVIPAARIAIEINGVYWHSEQWGRGKEYHSLKTQWCRDAGYELLQFWCYEVDNHWDQIVNLISSRLGIGTTSIYARSTHASRIDDRALVSRFIEDNHIQGQVNSRAVYYGLYHNNTLVSVMTFCKPRYLSSHQWEILRYCSLRGVRVVGGASKLLKAFIRDNQPTSIVTYADKRYSVGRTYEQIGMKYVRDTPPGYFYVKHQKVYSRYKMQKHKLSQILPDYDSSKSEVENCGQNGYYRVWDCGHCVYEWVAS